MLGKIKDIFAHYNEKITLRQFLNEEILESTGKRGTWYVLTVLIILAIFVSSLAG